MAPTSASARQRPRPRHSNTSVHDSNPRPQKRQRMQSSSPDPLLDLSPLSSLPSSNAPSSPCPVLPRPKPRREGLKLIPTSILLVSLPSILAHPPDHKYYIHSLVLSLAALRKCLALPALSPQIECRAWTGLAELGMSIISGGFSQSEDHPWATGMESEVRPPHICYGCQQTKPIIRLRKL